MTGLPGRRWSTFKSKSGNVKPTITENGGRFLQAGGNNGKTDYGRDHFGYFMPM
jgi:hypothetical protein